MQAETTAAERAKQELARSLGVDPSQIRTLDGRWLDLMQSGVIVELHIGRWRAHTALTNDDLGLIGDDRVANTNLMWLGSKQLLPEDVTSKLYAIESSGRKVLAKYGIKTRWGFLVPATAFEEWKAKNQEQKDRYFAQLAELIENYDAIRDRLMIEYRVEATKAYRREQKLDPRRMTRAEITEEWEYITPYLDRIAELIKPANEIKASFYWDEELSFVPLPSLLAQDQAEAERIDAERERAALQARAENDQLRSEVWVGEQSKYDLLRKREAMNREVLENARRQKENIIDGFLNEVVKRLRSLVYDASTDVLGAIKKNDGVLPARSVVQLKNLFEQVQQLNFYGDVEIEQAIAKVKAAFGEEKSDRNLTEIAARLQDIAVVARASLIGLDGAELPRTARELMSDDSLAESLSAADLLRSARSNLDLDQAVSTPIELPERRELDVLAA